MPTYRHRGEPCVSRDASGSILNPYLEAIILLNLAPTVGLRDRNGYLYLLPVLCNPLEHPILQKLTGHGRQFYPELWNGNVFLSTQIP